MLLYLRRPGGQSQFSAALALQIADRKPLRELESWVLENLGKPLNVETLAERVAMSPRNFARVFVREMKITQQSSWSAFGWKRPADDWRKAKAASNRLRVSAASVAPTRCAAYSSER